MTRSFAAAMRRANRMMQPARMTRATRSMHKMISGILIDAAFAPMTSFRASPDGPPKAPPRARPLASGAQLLTRRHRCVAGSRAYQLYLPGTASGDGPRGLILMLHGCNQTPADFAAGTHMNALAEKHGIAVAWPAQTKGKNASSCWNWFAPGHQRRGMGEPAILASLARKLTRDLGLGRETVFVAGLSAGGAMAVILGDVYPDVFSAVGVHSGLARGTARNVRSAMEAMRRGGSGAQALPVTRHNGLVVRRIVFQGDADSTVHPSNAAVILAAAVGDAAVPVRQARRSVRGRGYARTEFVGADGAILVELWMVEGAGHAWSGGRAAGSYTDASGPDASAQMMRFFLA